MARDGSVLVKFLADTLGFRRGTDDMVDALEDAARSTDRQTDRMATAFRDAGTKINRSTDKIGHDAKAGMREAGTEASGEFIQNLGEGIGSGQPDIKDAVLGTIGGIAPALGAAGAVIAVGASAALAIIGGIQAQQEKVKAAGRDLFDAMREGIVDASAREDLLEKALGVDNMYDAIGKARDQATRLKVPVGDVLAYLESAGRVATPALTAALAKSDERVAGVSTKAGNVRGSLSDAAVAAGELKDQAGFVAGAWQDAADAMAPMTRQAQEISRALTIASQRGKELASYAAAQYAAGNPAYGGSPGGKRK